MGARSIRMPDVGEGVAEAEIVEWSVKVGDLVREDQVVAAVMTDKATVEIPTPVAGTVVALGGGVGDVLAVGSELIRIEAPGLPETRPLPREEARAQNPSRSRPRRSTLPLTRRRRTRRKRGRRSGPPPRTRRPRRRLLRLSRRSASFHRRRMARRVPSARSRWRRPRCASRRARRGIDLRFVRGTGPAGRITHEDLDAYIARPPEAPTARAHREPNTAVETVKVVGMRRRIAQNMANSARRVAHFSYVEEVDVTPLEELRAALNAQTTADRPKLTMLPFLMLGVVKAIADFPQINAHYDDENEIIHRYGAVHLGIATQTPNGLMVPVVRHAETLGLYVCAREMRRVSEAARQGVAARDELSGSTITLTSLGALGGVASTPIINRPEVAIVGVNKIVVRPVWRDGGFVPRKTMNLSSSFDHRVVDGHDAATFIQRLRALLEAPATLFIED